MERKKQEEDTGKKSEYYEGEKENEENEENELGIFKPPGMVQFQIAADT